MTLTSERTIIKEFLKYLGKNAVIYLMWHLPRDGFNALLEALNSPLDVGLAWRLCGGRPRVVHELIYCVEPRWCLERCIAKRIDYCISVLSDVVGELARLWKLSKSDVWKDLIDRRLAFILEGPDNIGMSYFVAN